MENEQNISPNDPDLLIAKKIGAALPNINDLNDNQDSLLDLLFRYKSSISQKTDINSSEIWNSIQSEINETAEKAPVFTLSPAIKRYAIAATILITALVGSFLYQNLTTPRLVGESFAEIQEVHLSDGTNVTLRPYSKLFENSSSDKAQKYTLQGEAYFEVASNPERIFTVTTDRSIVEVLGTKFILSDWGNVSTVFLQEGSVQYSSLISKASIILEPGQSSSIDESTQEPHVTMVNEMVYTDWLSNELVFDDESVRMVFKELEQHFNIRIESQQILEDENISGSVQLNDLSLVLDDLELVLDGTFKQTGDNSFVFNLN